MIAGDALSQSFRPELPGSEYPTLNTKLAASSQESESHGGLERERGAPQIAPGPVNLRGQPRFSGPTAVPNEHLDLGGSNLRFSKVKASYMEWEPEQLDNGNYR